MSDQQRERIEQLREDIQKLQDEQAALKADLGVVRPFVTSYDDVDPATLSDREKELAILRYEINLDLEELRYLKFYRFIRKRFLEKRVAESAKRFEVLQYDFDTKRTNLEVVERKLAGLQEELEFEEAQLNSSALTDVNAD
ncbi:MAG: hypothetical protein Q4G41_01780 [Coriobacteriales bacterium]|nr:hypothetical protein [Coriobacteriales bacterium]